MSDSAELVRRLRALDCCALSDALDRLGLKGVVTGLARRSGEGRIAGRAVTVKLGVGDRPSRPPRHLCAAAIERAGPENVIVIEQRTGVNAACWGGLLTLAAKLRGVAGVIAEGLVRDIDEAVGHSFSIYARGLTAQTARGRIVETATDAPVEIGEVHVRAGDYVAADGSAAVFIEAGIIERVLETAEAIAVKEAEMAEALIRGASVSEVLSAAYENMLKS